ncbi:MAG: hypothetical protein WA611_11570, partial [Candidatus Acidiferrales bacterium]
MEKHLNAPHGGELVDLMAGSERLAEIQGKSRDWPSWDLTPRQMCDAELLLNGGFSPLRGFMCRADYESVCNSMRLADGKLWPIPITLDVTEEFARSIKLGSLVALRDPEGVMLAVLHVEEIWQPDLKHEAESVYGTVSLNHPGVAHILQKAHPWYVGGKLEGIENPHHYDFRSLLLTPAGLRADFNRLGW